MPRHQLVIDLWLGHVDEMAQKANVSRATLRKRLLVVDLFLFSTTYFTNCGDFTATAAEFHTVFAVPQTDHDEIRCGARFPGPAATEDPFRCA